MERLLALARRLFIERTDHGLVQFIRYAVVGGLAALVDFGVLTLCDSVLGVHYLLGAAFGFIAGLIVNYVLSITWIFHSSHRWIVEFGLFAAVGVAGLGLNELILWIGVDLLGWPVWAAKLASLAIVFLWNFLLRRVLFTWLGRRASANRAAAVDLEQEIAL